jgi:bifunctional NMN adenylyltransferase/nudix hydrolase
VLGSAHQARTPKNPFSWHERAEMIRLTLPQADQARVRFLPVRDYYDEARWVRAVRAGVVRIAAEAGLPTSPDVVLVGHFKDATSAYLKGFPGWTLEAAVRLPGADGTQVRDALFGAEPDALDATLAALVDVLPASTRQFLHGWSALPYRDALAVEWRMLRSYQQAWKAAPYPPVFVTVDAIVRCAGCVLLVERGKAPGQGLLAVPGGFIAQRETAYQSALRELEEETHLKLLDDTMHRSLRATAVFDHPDRSLRGRTITHAHYFDLGDRELPEVRADDDAASVAWVSIDQLGAMEDRFHDDHFHILDHFLDLTSYADAESERSA